MRCVVGELDTRKQFIESGVIAFNAVQGSASCPAFAECFRSEPSALHDRYDGVPTDW